MNIFFNTLFSLIMISLFATPVFSAQYYVSKSQGNDSNSGLTPETPWKTLEKVSNTSFRPGDTIFLRRGDVWSEQLTVTSSGFENSPIIYTSYGSGNNPLINLTEPCTDWTLISIGSAKVWRGTSTRAMSPWGAIRKGSRVTQYRDWRMRLADIENGYFFKSPEDYHFYFRWDAGNPGLMEIAAVDFGVYLKDKQYVIVDGIDVYGPASVEGLSQIFLSNCDHVTVRNCILRLHNRHGIMAKSGTTHCIYENIKASGHRSTAMYFWESGEGNKILNCEAFDSGTVISDHGDRGLIGIFRTPGVLIEGCYVHDNGNEFVDHIDAAISIVQSPHVSILRNLVKNAGGTAIMFAEQSHSGIAAYNIVDGWGVFGKLIVKNPYFAGIRIGGGNLSYSQPNCQIYNNLLLNGTRISGEWGALGIMYSDHQGLQVKNNIFYDNDGTYEVHARSRTSFRDWTFSHNVYYRTSGKAIYWQGKEYDYSHIIGDENGYYSFDTKQDKHSINSNPQLTSDRRNLEKNSPCINAGTWVGLTKDFYGNDVTEGNVNIGPFNTVQGDTISPPSGLEVSKGD